MKIFGKIRLYNIAHWQTHKRLSKQKQRANNTKKLLFVTKSIKIGYQLASLAFF